MRLPSRVVFPFGYRVTVKQVSDREMREFSDDDPGQPLSLDGCWYADHRTIYIRKCLGVRRKRYILAHEVAHAVNDWIHFCLDAETIRP